MIVGINLLKTDFSTSRFFLRPFSQSFLKFKSKFKRFFIVILSHNHQVQHKVKNSTFSTVFTICCSDLRSWMVQTTTPISDTSAEDVVNHSSVLSVMTLEMMFPNRTDGGLSVSVLVSLSSLCKLLGLEYKSTL